MFMKKKFKRCYYGCFKNYNMIIIKIKKNLKLHFFLFFSLTFFIKMKKKYLQINMSLNYRKFNTFIFLII